MVSRLLELFLKVAIFVATLVGVIILSTYLYLLPELPRVDNVDQSKLETQISQLHKKVSEEKAVCQIRAEKLKEKDEKVEKLETQISQLHKKVSQAKALADVRGKKLQAKNISVE